MKNLCSFLFALACLMPATLSAKVPHRLICGFFQYSVNGYGYGQFYADELDNATILEPGDGELGVFCGAAADGIYYTCEYRYSSTSGPVPSGFMAYNTTTRKKTLVGQYNSENENPYLKFQDMTYDYTSKTMYAIGFEMGLSSLFTFDLHTGQPTKVVDLKVSSMTALACDKSGQLYGIAQDGKLYKIDKTTGQCTAVYSTGMSGTMGAQSMDFDLTNGKLYWAARTLSTDGNAHLIEVDLTKTPISHLDLGPIAIESALQGLYIPYVLDGDNAPDAPTDLKATVAAQGAHQASLSWTNPTTTFGGDPLTDLQSIIVLRNGEQIASLSPVTVGASMTYEDTNVPTRGDYHYQVLGVNAIGKGLQANAFVYVGEDNPDVPTNINVAVGDGCQSATISWEHPVKGAHDGYFTTDGLSYRIVRYPDEVEVAKDITGTSYTDKSFRRLGQYSYKVFAYNAYGESGKQTPEAYVLGKAIDLSIDEPYTLDFNDKNLFYNQWTVKDGNNDAYSWTFNTMAPTYQFRSSSPGAEYFVNPGISNSGNAADEWLISPPFNFVQGSSYQVVLTARVLNSETLKITSAPNNEIAKQSNIQEVQMTFDQSLDDGVTPFPFADYTVNLPAVTADYTGCVGVHLVTPYPATGFSMLQIASITVKEVDPTGIRTTTLGTPDDTRVVARYAPDGSKVPASHKGLQILKLANGKTIKVMVK